MVDKCRNACYDMEAASVATYGRVVELVDSLDSGSSVHCGRAGSSPASPTKETVERLSLFLYEENHALDAWFNKAYGGE